MTELCALVLIYYSLIAFPVLGVWKASAFGARVFNGVVKIKVVMWRRMRTVAVAVCAVVVLLCGGAVRGAPESEPAVTAGLHHIGALRTVFHAIGGSLYALDEHTLLLAGYAQDGGAPGIVLRYRVRGDGDTHYTAAAKFIRPAGITNEEWVLVSPSAYLDGRYRRGEWDVVMPVRDRENAPVPLTQLTGFQVWCDLAASLMADFTEAERFAAVPAVASPGRLARHISALLLGTPPCPTLGEWACHRLSPRLNLHWTLNDDGRVDFRVEGAIAADSEYMAVGVSGSPDTYRMLGGDVVVAYMRGNRAYAHDYYLSQYSQCSGVGGTGGACPDAEGPVPAGTEDVTRVSGRVEDGVVHVAYSRMNVTGDSGRDRPYTYRGRTQIIWATGPLSSSAYPLIHTDRIRDSLELDLCMAETCEPLASAADTDVDTVAWEPQCIDHQQLLRFEIGPSGGARGYTAITGNPSWGIAYYVNGLLVPYVLVERGVTYTVQMATSRQHPVYIATNDRYGGYETQILKQNRSPGSVEVLAGIDASSGQSTAQGDLDTSCTFAPRSPDSHLEYPTFAGFAQSLNHSCPVPGAVPGPGAEFAWTVPAHWDPAGPPLYYQCAVHQHLGWRMVVVPDNSTLDCATYLDSIRIQNQDENRGAGLLAHPLHLSAPFLIWASTSHILLTQL